MNIRFVFILILGMFVIVSCTTNFWDTGEDQIVFDDVTRSRGRNADIVSVVAPDTVSLNEKFTIQLTYQFKDGCGQFKNVLVDAKDRFVIFQVEDAYVERPGDMCTMVIREETRAVEWVAPGAGLYLFRFAGSRNIGRRIVVKGK